MTTLCAGLWVQDHGYSAAAGAVTLAHEIRTHIKWGTLRCQRASVYATAYHPWHRCQRLPTPDVQYFKGSCSLPLKTKNMKPAGMHGICSYCVLNVFFSLKKRCLSIEKTMLEIDSVLHVVVYEWEKSWTDLENVASECILCDSTEKWLTVWSMLCFADSV